MSMLLRASGLLAAGAAVRISRVLHFATPPRVASLVSELVDAEPGMEVYDPTCGNGRLLFAVQQAVASRNRNGTDGSQKQVSLWGQERDLMAYLLMRLGALARGLPVNCALGDTMRRPAFLDGSEHALRRFDRIVGNPMWNQRLSPASYRSDLYGRFRFGEPPEDNADWAWVQHMHASLKDDGSLAVLLDREITSRGRPESLEGAIRRAFVEGGLVEAVLTCGGPFRVRHRLRGAVARALVPQASLLVVSKQPRWAGRVLLIDGSSLLDGYARREASLRSGVETVLRIYRERAAVPGVSALVTSREIAAGSYDLTPRRWIGR